MDRAAMREIGTWLTVSESARRIGISRQGLYPYLYDGRVRAVETRAGWLVDPEAVERMARERTSQRGLVGQDDVNDVAASKGVDDE